MKFLKTLLGQEEKTPTWDIKPPEERPAPRKRLVDEEPPPPAAKKQESDSIFADHELSSFEIEADAIPDDNPYQTYSWEKDPENDTRKLKTIQISEKSDAPTEDQFNPYDTGTLRRGWKK